MADARDFEAMAKVCLAAHDAVATHGSTAMKEATRLLLFELGREIARRQTTGSAPADPEA